MIYVNSGKICVKFNEETAVIESLCDGVREYIGDEIPVFEVGLRDAEGELSRISANEFVLAERKIDKSGFFCVYKGNDKLEVSMAMEISGEKINWKIRMKVPEKIVGEWVQFPQIAVPHDLKDNGGSGKILWGFNEGSLVDNLSEREKGFPYVEPAYPHVSLMGIYPAIVETQFMAYYNDESGIYFGAHDKDDYLKGIDYYRYKNSIKLQFRHFCGKDFGEEYEMEYPMVMQFFSGDWYDAADIYRQWFYAEKSSKFKRIDENEMLPSWYGESPVVITYPVRGIHDTDEMIPNRMYPYINALKHVERLGKAFDSKIMVLLMHWEGSAPWAPPYVWPPYGGKKELEKLISALHERGDILGVYCSGLGWTQRSNVIKGYSMEQEFEEKDLRKVMCLSPQQELLPSKICTFQRFGFDMCPTSPLVSEILKKEVKGMIGSGIDYIQLMDQNHGGTSHFCYSKSHSHPPVPGKWQVDAVKKLYGEVFKDTGKVLFGCESAAAEAYVTELLFSDNRFLLNYKIGKPVPVYAYILHEYVNNFMGNQVCANMFFDYTKSPDNLFMRIAYSFMAGDMLTVVLNQDGEITWNWGQLNEEEQKNLPDYEKSAKLIKNLNKWRSGEAKKYLHTGKMMKPFDVHCGECEVHMRGGKTKIFEDIFTCAWESKDEKYGQFLINYTTGDIICSVDLPDKEFFFTDSDGICEMTDGNRIKVPALSAILIESK